MSLNACCLNDKRFSEAELCTKLLSDRNRFHILCLLKKGPLCVSQIEEHLKISQNLVSHHLKILMEGNLLTSRRKGQKVYYARNDEMLKEYGKLIKVFLVKEQE